MKYFRYGYIYFGLIAAIAMIIILMVIDYYFFDLFFYFNYFYYFIIFVPSWISVTLLCWIIYEKIEKAHVKKKMMGIETDTPNQVMDRIKKALEMRKTSKAEILTNLYALQANDSLSNFEFFDIIGETYQLNPEFFMLSIYQKMRRKFRMIYGDEGMRVMNKYILEKFCLDEGEQIIYELNGKIRQKVPKKKYLIKVNNGTIYVTNSRIIAHGNFVFELTTEYINHRKAENAYISSSAPCYGYQFPIKNLYNLTPIFGSKNRKLSYFILQYNKITIKASRKEHREDKLFAILDKFQIRK